MREISFSLSQTRIDDEERRKRQERKKREMIGREKELLQEVRDTFLISYRTIQVRSTYEKRDWGI